MIKKIYSRVNPAVLLNIIYTREGDPEKIESTKRNEITDPAQFLQAMAIELPLGGNVKPHKHNSQERTTNSTHEAHLIFKGKVEISIYDTDNSLVETVILKEGDCSVIIEGGHSIKSLMPSQVFEFKNGPYTGPDKDRTYFS